MQKFNPQRVRLLNTAEYTSGPLIYWMSRDQRVHDNWALLLTAQRAQQQQVPMAVVFCLTPTFPNAQWRHYDFMLAGLKEVEAELTKKNIPFFVLLGDPLSNMQKFVQEHGVGGVVCDFSPLKIGREWRDGLAQSVAFPVVEVDAHNIVPVWVASPKAEVGARTLRPKINKLLPEFLTEFPAVPSQKLDWPNKPAKIKWAEIEKKIDASKLSAPVDWIESGEQAAQKALEVFLQNRLTGYTQKRNDPSVDGQSNLSPYLHFGHIAAQRVALETELQKAPDSDKTTFLEELIIRRELSDNYCFYNQDYDSFAGFPTWAQKSLDAHRADQRDHLYDLATLESAQTADPLWNACQTKMVQRGKMHGYMRMYWAKKILEWTESPEQAQSFALYLNDTYQLDGRDPNGYAGVAWSIGGVHDRPWFDRPVYGVIRYMNSNGAKRKFDVERYIEQFPAL